MRKYNNSVLGVLGFMDTWLSSDTPGFSLRSRLALQACWSTRILIRSDTFLITNSKRKMSHLHHFYAHEQSDLDRLRQAEIIPSSVQTIQTSLINLNKLRLNVDPKTSNEKKRQQLPDVYLTDIKPQTLHLFLGFYSFFFRFQTVSASQSSFDLRINSPHLVWGLQISESSINQIIFHLLGDTK